MKSLEKKMDLYFDKLGFAHETRRSYRNSVNRFIDWCGSQEIDYIKATIDQLYAYISYLRGKGLSEHTVRERICSVSHLFRATRRKLNPAFFVRLKKRETTMPTDLLDDETMVDIYLSILPRTMSDTRNKVIMGMVLFQGMTRGEIGSIETEHIDIPKMRIYIPASKSINARYVPLRQLQVTDMEDYLYRLRNQMMVDAGKKTGRMFFSMGAGVDVDNLLWLLCKKIKRRFPQFRNMTQLRESRINIWLNTQKQDLRTVQYLSGMKYASSLLRHKRTDSDKLKRKLDIIHPMDKFR